MPEAVTWTSGKRPWRKPSIRRQKQCSNPLPISTTWTQGIPKRTGPLKRRKKTPMERISPSTPPLLIYLVGNKHLPLSRLPLPTQRRTTMEALGMERDKAKTHLQQTSIPSQRRKKTSPKLSASTAGKKAISPTGVLKRKNKSQKTNIGLGDFHVNDWC